MVHCNAERYLVFLNRLEQSLLAFAQEPYDCLDVRGVEAGLLCDVATRVTPVLERRNLLGKLHGAVLPACEVFDQAHQQKILFRSVDDDRWNLSLAVGLIGFKSALPANQVVLGLPIPVLARGYCDGLLQTNLSDVVDDLPELLLAPLARVKDDDLVDWDHVDMRVVPAVHAASIFLRLAIVAK